MAFGTVFGAGLALSGPAEAADDSAVTVRAVDYDPDYQNAPFPDLAVTVSQTDNLIAQAVTVSWTGGKLSEVPNSQQGGRNYLQIAQCWGDEPGSNGTHPDRTTCQYGGFGSAGASRWSNVTAERVAAEDSPYTSPSPGWWEPAMTSIPFRSVTGVTVAAVVDSVRVDPPVDVNNNQFFTAYTTNEVTWAGSHADGAGELPFELQTAQQAPGLGCGAPATVGSAVTGQSCWLVVIPRGEADPGASPDEGITQSGLFWDTWKHHLAVKLDFKPIGVRCAIGTAERQLAGSELVARAVAQWQPALCGPAGGAVYSLLTGPESDALLSSTLDTDAPLALTSRALSSEEVSGDGLVYAPIALTGISIALSIDRFINPLIESPPADIAARERQRFDSVNLTPRLLAKLLTSSYRDALPAGANISHLGSNPSNITKDPDFLAVNDPEWSYQWLAGPGVADALVPLGRSDAAWAVWSYILADDEAAAFLAGTPDPWGMHVNPWYSTNPALNPTGAPLELPRDDFPKADPVERPAEDTGREPVNLVTWRPYTSDFDTGGYLVLRGDPKALGAWDPTAQPPKYGSALRDLPGIQKVIGMTDTAAGARYALVQAALLNPAGEFVAPTEASLTAAAQAMTPDPQQAKVLDFDPTSTQAMSAGAAYPLAVPVYAATDPAGTSDELRSDYAAFVSYVVTDGQTPGVDDGELPPGYAPIPVEWRDQALAAASAIAPVAPTPSATPTPTATATPSPLPSAAPPAALPTEPVPSLPAESPTGPFDAAPSPTPSGRQAGPLVGSATPADPPVGQLSSVVPVSALAGVAAALGVPFVSNLRRRP